MTDWDDVLPEADEVPEVKEEAQPPKKEFSGRSRGGGNWDKTYEPLRVPASEMKRTGRDILFTSTGVLPEDKTNFLEKVVMKLAGFDFVWRTGADDRSPGEVLLNTLIRKHQGKQAIYLPWPKFGTDIDRTKVVMERAKDEAYRIAASFRSDFNSLSNGLKGIIARDVHRVLGPDCRSPIAFLVAWDKFGFEDTTRMKYLNNSHALMIALAREYGIPVFNFNNEESVVKMSGMVKTITGTE